MKLVRLSDLGGLPVGLLVTTEDGVQARDRSVTFRKWTAKTALEIGQFRREGEESDLAPLQLVHETLVKLVKTWCGLDFDTIDEKKRGEVLDTATYADVMTAWVMLRIKAFGPKFPAQILCPHCRGKVQADDKPKAFTYEVDLNTLEVMAAGWKKLADGNYVEHEGETADFGSVMLEDGFEFRPRVPSPSGPMTLTAMRFDLGAPKWKAIRDLRTLKTVTGVEPATIRSVVRRIEHMDPAQLATMKLPDFAEALTIKDMAIVSEALRNVDFPGPHLGIEERCPNEMCGQVVRYEIDPRYGGDFFSVRGSSPSTVK